MLVIYYIIYLLVSTVLLSVFNSKNTKAFLVKFIFVAFLPGIGWLFPSVWPKKIVPSMEGYFEQYMEKQTTDIEYEVSHLMNKVNIQQELDVVSIEEVLSISNIDVRRKAMLDVLKGDALKYLDIIQLAITNEDTETSHYAVSAMNEVKRELTILLQKLSVQYNENKEDVTVLHTYSNVIHEYLLSGFLDQQTEKQYKYTLIMLLEKLISLNAATEQQFQLKIATELALHQIANAESTVEMYKAAFPYSEEAYLTAMSVYFEAKSIEKLQHELLQLRKSSIKISNKGLETIRYWSETTKNDQVIQTE